MEDRASSFSGPATRSEDTFRNVLLRFCSKEWPWLVAVSLDVCGAWPLPVKARAEHLWPVSLSRCNLQQREVRPPVHPCCLQKAAQGLVA